MCVLLLADAPAKFIIYLRKTRSEHFFFVQNNLNTMKKL